MLDGLLKGCSTPEYVDALYAQLLQRMINHVLDAEVGSLSLRKLTRNRRIFPNDDAVFKAMCLAINEASRKWKVILHWKADLQVF